MIVAALAGSAHHAFAKGDSDERFPYFFYFFFYIHFFHARCVSSVTFSDTVFVRGRRPRP